MNPFILKEKIEPSFFEAIFKNGPKFNAVIEINNLLATKEIKQISEEEVTEIARRYGINLKKSFREHFQTFYSVYLAYCFEDHKISKNEIEDLHHLKKILCLSDIETSEINRNVSERIYITETEKVLKDGRLTEEEKRFLEELKSNLSISENTAKKIYAQLAQDYFKNFFNEIVSDNRISLEEEKELEEIAKSLGIEVNMDDMARSTFDKMKVLWLIENDKIPVINVDLPIFSPEECYFKTGCLLMVDSEKDVKDFPLRKAESINLDNDNIPIKPEDNLTALDKGTLYLTSERLIFSGTKGTQTFGINKIQNLILYLNGIEIEFEAEEGESLFFSFHDHLDIFMAILSRIKNQK